MKKIKNKKFIKTIFIFIVLVFIFNFLRCLDPRLRYKGYKDCHEYSEKIENKIFLECFSICNFWNLDSDIRCFYLTDSLNFRTYLGHSTEDGHFYLKHDSSKIIIEITHPKSIYFDTKDTYYFSELKKLNNIEF